MSHHQPPVVFEQRTVVSNENKDGFFENGGLVLLVVVAFLLIGFCIQMGRLSEWSKQKAYELGLSSKSPITSAETPPLPAKHHKAAH